MRKRPDNWSTKRLTKTTWTGLITASMYFWSVSLVHQLSRQFFIFLVDHKNNLVDQKIFGIPKKNVVYQKEIWSTKKKIVQSQGIFGQSLGIFSQTKKNLVDQKKNLVYQKKIWSTKKMRNRPDNWYTKETDQKYMDTAKVFPTYLVIVFSLFFQVLL